MHAAVSGLAQEAKAGGVEMKQRQRDEQPAHQHGGRRHHRPKLHFGIELLLERLQLLGIEFWVGFHGNKKRAQPSAGWPALGYQNSEPSSGPSWLT